MSHERSKNRIESEQPLEFDQLLFPERIVGPNTAGVHPEDTAFWESSVRIGRNGYMKKLNNEVIYNVGQDGIIYFKKGLLPFGTRVKISCTHNR